MVGEEASDGARRRDSPAVRSASPIGLIRYSAKPAACARRTSSGAIAADIARQIGVSATTIYAELKRGQEGVTLDKNFRPAYDPELAQKRVQENLRRRGRKKGADQT